MSLHRLLRWLVAVCLLVAVSSTCAEERNAPAEIEHLLQFIASSNCRFIRSGKEYSSKEAVAHLRMKSDSAGDRVKTAEDFIEGIASRSYLTGKPYAVRLPGEEPKPTGPWLTAELETYRKGSSKKE